MADPAVSLTEARNMLALYLEAERAILRGAQSYTIKDRTFTRADLSDVTRGRKDWETRVTALERGGTINVRRVLPRDI